MAFDENTPRSRSIQDIYIVRTVVQSNPYKMFAADFQLSWPSRPKIFCRCNSKNFNTCKIYCWQKLIQPTFLNEVLQIFHFPIWRKRHKFVYFDKIVSCGQISWKFASRHKKKNYFNQFFRMDLPSLHKSITQPCDLDFWDPWVLLLRTGWSCKHL